MLNPLSLSLFLECDDGLYYDGISGNCVSECPCDLIGNSDVWQCVNSKQPAIGMQ